MLSDDEAFKTYHYQIDTPVAASQIGLAVGYVRSEDVPNNNNRLSQVRLSTMPILTLQTRLTSASLH